MVWQTFLQEISANYLKKTHMHLWETLFQTHWFFFINDKMADTQVTLIFDIHALTLCNTAAYLSATFLT